MRRCVALLAVAAVACGSASAAETAEMWTCHLGGPPNNSIVLAHRDTRSYVKIGSQRAPATYSESEGARRWKWGSNVIVLDAEDLGQYFEGGNVDTPKAVFRCRRMG